MAQVQTDYASLRQPVLREDVGQIDRLPTEPNYPFRLMHHPQQVGFEIIKVAGKDVGYWLPIVSPLPLKPGSNMIELGEGNGPVLDRALIALARRGWVVLNENETWNGLPIVSKFPCDGGTFFCTVFDMPKKVAGKREIRLINDQDQDARWRHSLVMAGKLPMPDQEAIEERLKQAEKRLERWAMKLNGNAQVAKKYKVWEERVEMMRAAILPGSDGDPLVETKGGKRGAA